VRDIVGLYLNPPAHALVLCVDGKSQIQALDRTQPLLPMRPGQIERRSHDYQRHGTTSLFAVLDIATGRVIGRCYQRHRAVEFRRFLATVEQAVPANFDIHLVLDNYATHKAPPVRAWLARHPRYHLHFTPTSASWLNQVERWFALLADKQIKRRRPSQRARTEGRHHRIHPCPQRRSEILRLDQVRRCRPPNHCPILLRHPRRACHDLFNEPLIQDTS
jgi:DDE superfamily endonuclease